MKEIWETSASFFFIPIGRNTGLFIPFYRVTFKLVKILLINRIKSSEQSLQCVNQVGLKFHQRRSCCSLYFSSLSTMICYLFYGLTGHFVL